jgi:phage N-6-adenine-methyltransferase
LSVHFSSKTDEWETPQELFDALNEEFDFDLDVCATPQSAKLPNFYTKGVDGLSMSWNGYRCWMNPPYGRVIGKWVEKCSQNKCVALLPARTDTKWFHDYILGKAEIRFIKGRLKFVGEQKGHSGSAPFPSMIVIFK